MIRKYHKPDLDNRRENCVLMHLARNFISLPCVLHELYFAGRSVDTSRKVLTRLVRRGFLAKYRLLRNEHYYRLGPESVKRWGFPRTRTEKLGAQRLPYEIGALAYTSMDVRPRKRLFPHELLSRLPWFPESLLQWAYLWENNRLVSIRVEHRARAEHVVAKLSDQLYRYSQHFEFRRLIEEGRFLFVVITATDHQELALQAEAQEQRLRVEVLTANYPELIHFI